MYAVLLIGKCQKSTSRLTKKIKSSDSRKSSEKVKLTLTLNYDFPITHMMLH